MVVAVTLNPAIDLTLQVPGWREGDVNRACAASKTIGGKGINVSRLLRRLGAPTTSLTVVGSDSVQEFQRLARGIGFPIVYITVPGETRTNVHVVDPESHRLLKVNQSGEPITGQQLDHLMRLFRQQVRSARYVVVAGSLPPGTPTDTYARLTAMAHESGARVILDAEGEALMTALAEKPFLVKPNRFELEKSLGLRLDTPGAILEGARSLVDLGANHAVITDGGAPAVCLLGGKAYQIDPLEIIVRGATGAGDSFSAGLVAAFMGGMPLLDSVRQGIAAAAATCAQPEGELASVEAITDLLPQVTLKQLK